MRRFNQEWQNKPRKRGNPEAHLVLQIIHYIALRGGWAKKIKTKGSMTARGSFIFDPYAAKGVPDILYFYNGKMGWIEAKSAKGKQSPEQIAFQELCNKSNTPYILAYSLEDIQKNLTNQ